MTVKEKILDVTIELIKENKGNPHTFTVREIAKKAEVGVGLINYHFQSKENLIELCIQKIIDGIINNSKPDMNELTLLDKIKTCVKIPLDFLMENPEISKISILNDFMNGQQGDNTFKTLSKYYYNVSNYDFSEDNFFKTVFLIHGLQGIFLRRELYKDKFDFSNKEERNRLINSLIDNLFGDKK